MREPGAGIRLGHSAFELLRFQQTRRSRENPVLARRLCVSAVIHFLCAFLFLAVSLVHGAALPTPEQFAGFRIGAEKKLVRWDRIVEYMRQAAAASPRVQGGGGGQDHQRQPVHRGDGHLPGQHGRTGPRIASCRSAWSTTGLTDAEAEQLLEKQRAVVLITCNIHSTEIGSSQMALELVHRLATEDSPYVRNILDNVILLLVPSLNPDGQIMVTDWYNKNLGTPWEYSFLPELYHKYTGHDNNRDAFMNTQVESRLINRLTYKEWFPHVFFDEHQMGGAGRAHLRAAVQEPHQPERRPGDLGAERPVRLRHGHGAHAARATRGVITRRHVHELVAGRLPDAGVVAQHGGAADGSGQRATWPRPSSRSAPRAGAARQPEPTREQTDGPRPAQAAAGAARHHAAHHLSASVAGRQVDAARHRRLRADRHLGGARSRRQQPRHAGAHRLRA